MDLPDLGVGPFKRQSPRVAQIDESLATDVYDRFQESGPVISIRPYKGEGTMTTAESFLTSLHLPRTKWRGITRNVTDPSAFEIVFDSDRELLQFRYVGGNEDQRELLKTELEGHYQDAEVAELPPAFLNVAEGKHVAAARLRLRNDDYLVPIKNHHDNQEWFADRDPVRFDHAANDRDRDRSRYGRPRPDRDEARNLGCDLESSELVSRHREDG